MVNLQPQQFKTFRKVHKGLIRKYECPFPVKKKVGKAANSYLNSRIKTIRRYIVCIYNYLYKYKGR
jgi:hypothetical protein